RAKQDRDEPRDPERTKVLPVLIHGDAAFAGQGVVSEVLNLANLEGYGTGGTVHVIINNQVGFTTNPEDARSTPYCTDIARVLRAPVFHVNGEDPEAVVWAVQLAVEYRQTFRQDVLIALYSYRKYGHNEGDEPAFTQPLMYEVIRRKQPPREVHARRRRAEGAGNAPFDWGVGEHLAFATLLDEGAPVRFSGQDARRGTFSHRHAVLSDAKDGKRYTPLAHLREGQGQFDIFDSPLSEAGV